MITTSFLNTCFDRNDIAKEMKQLLSSFETNCKNLTYKKGIYIYGSPGSGKTEFVMNILKDLNYDVIKYDAGDVRNKTLIDTITSNNVSNRNVLQMMTKKVKPIAIVMDEIDGMNNGDKGGITALIKIIRQKKTKKQKMELMTMNPIICIGNYYVDKKIKELIKVCNTFELKRPSDVQITNVIQKTFPNFANLETERKTKIISYIQGDLRKLSFVLKLFDKKADLMNSSMLDTFFCMKSFHENSKEITKQLIQNPVRIENHNRIMNDTDRTIVALLWHENIVDILSHQPIQTSYPIYLKLLKNICFADYIDRITFQHQIWQFNEMSSLIKTLYNNKICHDSLPDKLFTKPMDIRFTKVLTKYSTEYNNMQFIYSLCQELDMDKKDLVALFQEMRLYYGDADKIYEVFDNHSITKLDMKRMYRYLDKNVKKESEDALDELDEEDDF
uniref:AAA+ ATPase domain-containing protein n=1 Tax=viral metagenome TaxID=1070528 RepID=A0A6C0I309_9ZZZZ